MFYTYFLHYILYHTQQVKGKAIPLQDWTGPEGSRSLRPPDFKTVGTWRWQGCQPYALTAFTPHEVFLVIISVRGSVNSRTTVQPEDHANDKFQWHHPESNPKPSGL
jgi:hypothetical protein